MPTAESILAELRSRVAGRVETSESDLRASATDRSGYQSASTPLAVVYASNVNDVAETLKLAFEHRVPVVPRGAGTGLAGGSIGSAGEIVLSTLEMNRVLELNPADQIAVVEPGVINGQFNESLKPKGLWFPPDPASRGISTIGGNIATNAGGLLCAKYGVTRESILGLRVALSDGRILDLGKRTIKGVTGLDLTSLFIGSEGTLGVIVEATLRLRSLPKGEPTTLLIGFESATTAAKSASKIVSLGLTPAAMELIDEMSVKFISEYLGEKSRTRAGAWLLLQFDGQGAQAEAQIARESVAAEAAWLKEASGTAQSEELFEFRRAFHPALAARGNVLIEDVAVPRSRLSEMFSIIESIGNKYSLDIPTVAHAGDGNLHPNFIVQEAEIPKQVWDAASELFRAALSLGGTLTGEHGVGLLKRRWLQEELGQDQFELQRRIKAVFDPKGILNPGKVF